MNRAEFLGALESAMMKARCAGGSWKIVDRVDEKGGVIWWAKRQEGAAPHSVRVVLTIGHGRRSKEGAAMTLTVTQDRVAITEPRTVKTDRSEWRDTWDFMNEVLIVARRVWAAEPKIATTP